MLALPKLYAIVDAASFSQSEELYKFAQELIAGGATFLQYRNKSGSACLMLEHALELRRIVGNSARLVMNDRADLSLGAGFDGCHVGQDDLSAKAVREIIGNDRILGVSTHNPEQTKQADESSADYVAVGPVFQTASKANPDPVIGLEGLRKARSLTSKPLVAIGGITRSNSRQALDAGADSVAVIADLVSEPKKAVEDFLSLFKQ